MRVTPPALVGESAVRWFRLMPHEVVWVVHPGRSSASPMLAGGPGSGLTAAFDAVLADLAKEQGRLARERERATRLVAQRDAEGIGRRVPAQLGECRHGRAPRARFRMMQELGQHLLRLATAERAEVVLVRRGTGPVVVEADPPASPVRRPDRPPA